MAEVINLRLARKAHKRTQAQLKAAENRAKAGRTKGEKARDEAEAVRTVAHLDAHRREGE